MDFLAECERRMDIYDAISQERDFQDNKHGTDPHEMGTWLMILEFELAEAKEALVKGGIGRDSVRHELIQIAAVAVAALEQHGLEAPPDEKRLP